MAGLSCTRHWGRPWATKDSVSIPKCRVKRVNRMEMDSRVSEGWESLAGVGGNLEGCLEEAALELRSGDLSQKSDKDIIRGERESTCREG